MKKLKGLWTSHCFKWLLLCRGASVCMLQPVLTYWQNLNRPVSGSRAVEWIHLNLTLARQRLLFFFSVAGSVWHTVAFYVMFRRTWGGALSVCDHRITIPLLWCDTLSVTRVHGPSVTSACKAFFKELVLGQIFLCQPSELCVLCGTLLALFVRLH